MGSVPSKRRPILTRRERRGGGVRQKERGWEGWEGQSVNIQIFISLPLSLFLKLLQRLFPTPAGGWLCKGLWVTHFLKTLTCFSHLYTSMRAQHTQQRWKEREEIRNRGGMKRSGPAGSRVAPRLGASRPWAQARSFTAASQPPDGSYPSALNCCSDSCHNNQVAFVCTRHPALVYCFWKQLALSHAQRFYDTTWN